VSEPGGQLARPLPLALPAVSRGRAAASVLWALLPLLTVGLAAGPVFVHAAVRLRSWALGMCGVGYLAAWITGQILAAHGHGVHTPVAVAGTLMSAAVVPLASCTHAFIIRPRVFPQVPPYSAVDLAVARLRKREDAGDLLRRDPELARELGVGRPDLRLGSYDDGGLLDINHVPAEYIVTVLGFDRETADRITAARESAGRFTSARELATQADLPYDLIDSVKHQLLFL
jgi:hypothetical protein